jgi:putative flippase GtrA
MRTFTKLVFSPADNTLLQIPRALLASCIAAAFDVVVLVWLVEALHWHPAPAAVVGYIVGMVLQYLLCRYWVFASNRDSDANGFGVFALLSLVGLGITWGVIAALHDCMPYTVVKVLSLGLTFAWNFASRKWLVFRPNAKSTPIIDLGRLQFANRNS